MELIYIDSLFFLNLAVDYLLCLASAKVCGLCLKRLRYFLAALLGAAYSVAVFLPGLGFLSGPLFKLGTGLLIALIAYGSEAHPLRCAGVFLAVSALFGGVVWAVSLSGGGSLVLPLSFKSLFLTFAICYVGLDLFFRRRAATAELPRVQVRLVLAGKESLFMALVDSGNSLCDPISGCRVMVLSPNVLKPILKADTELFFRSDPVELLEKSADIPALSGKLRLIPYSAVGGSGLLPVFRPDSIFIDGKPEKELLTAVSTNVGGDGFEAVI